MTYLACRILVALLLSTIPGTLGLTAPSCNVTEYCRGYSLTRLPGGVNAEARLMDLRDEFCGCEVIGGSVNIYLDNSETEELTEDDFNFLYHVKEIWGAFQVINVRNAAIHLPNLALVRGEHRYPESNVTWGIFNSSLNALELPQFRELSQGNVLVHESKWCGVDTVNWEDIIEDKTPVQYDEFGISRNRTEECTAMETSCYANCTSGRCWSHSVCQTLNKVTCEPFCQASGSRCADVSTFGCCDAQCAAGCGNTPTDCIACKNFDESGTCVGQCTAKETFNPDGTANFNPAGSVQVGDHLCVPSCPAGQVDQRGFCLDNCGEGFFVSGGVCEQCVGECPSGTECDGWNFNEHVAPGPTLDSFINQECAVVNGHILINRLTVAEYDDGSLTEAHLERFRFIKVIRGSLLIQFWHSGLPDMDFFRNVEYVGSEDLDTIASSGNAIGIASNFDSSSPSDTGLSRIDLSRLKRITHGNVVLALNPQLCYYGDFHNMSSSYFQFIEQQVNAINSSALPPFVSMDDCESEGKGCHSECVRDSWCWGPEDTNCVECVHFYHQRDNRCVLNCNEYNDTFENSAVTPKLCEVCHEECIGCTGSGPFNCIACRTYAIHHNESSTECVSQCPIGFYLNATTSTCERCHVLCLDGCTGPGNYVGQDGCNNCKVVSFNATFSQISCVPDCAFNLGQYNARLPEATDGVPANNLFCGPCHPLCLTCSGPGSDECLACKNVSLPMGAEGNETFQCLLECPDDYYEDSIHICRQCHEECIVGCTGSSPQDCSQCRNLRTEVQTSGEYECVGSCGVSFYADYFEGLPTCLNCDPACQQCIGPGRMNCTVCITNSLTESERDEEVQILIVENGTAMYSTQNATLASCQLLDAIVAGDNSDSLPWYYILLLGGGLPLAFLAFVLIFAFLGYRYWMKKRGPSVKEYEGDMQHFDNQMYGTLGDAYLKPTLLPQPKLAPNLTKITIVTEDQLELLDELGSGAFGTVYKGYWRPEGEEHQYTVAIKVLNTSTAEAQTELLEEGVAMASMEHSNVVRLYALCMGENMMLVSQYVMMGSLISFLREHKNQLNADTMMTFIHQIADGMSYLEEKRMVHRDLAARNVLVQSYENVKITDFGLTKCLDIGETEYKSTGGKVPVRWLAPECLFKKEYSHKSDVWACGVTIWEILTFGGRPYSNKNTKEVVVSVSKGTRLPQPQTCSIELYSTMLSCWLANPDSRPDFSSLCSKFAHFCGDPARYISTTADEQLTDYSQLPTNDPAVVDLHVYELPVGLDGSGKDKGTIQFSEVGEYDNPEGTGMQFSPTGDYDNPAFEQSIEAMDYIVPEDEPVAVNLIEPKKQQQQKQQQHSPTPAYSLRTEPMSADSQVTSVDDIKMEDYCEIDESAEKNDYDYIPDDKVGGSPSTVLANEYTYIDEKNSDLVRVIEAEKVNVQNRPSIRKVATDKPASNNTPKSEQKSSKKFTGFAAVKSRFEKSTVNPKDSKENNKKGPKGKKSSAAPSVDKLSRTSDYVDDDYPEWNMVGMGPAALEDWEEEEYTACDM